MCDFNTQKLPSMEEAQILECQKLLAEWVLGLAAYVGMSSLLKPDNDMELVWEPWIALTGEGAKPAVMQICMFLKHLQPLVKLMAKYNDIAMCMELQWYQAEMEAMLAEVNHDNSDPEQSQCLLKVICDMLHNLVSEVDVQVINQLLLASLENNHKQDESD
ncbi:hypothetical protein EV401DRAFT_2066347 [Pisolithus croceorrhizus]|nr:hypothetical protein EV401DRAFT_2066347 [Pisolithus croceorrhizus]